MTSSSRVRSRTVARTWVESVRCVLRSRTSPASFRRASARSGTAAGFRRTPVYAAQREDIFHVLRHTYASVQLEAGESIVSLSTRLGHSSSAITLNHYAHYMPGAGHRGLAAMDSWLEQDQSSIAPEKCLVNGWTKNPTLKPQVKYMMASGAGLKVKYKETARGGLAVNIVEY
jgi:hypothetical protein